MPDEARDGRNVALKFLSDCWPARLSKAEFLHQNFSMPNIFHDCILCVTNDFMEQGPAERSLQFCTKKHAITKNIAIEISFMKTVRHAELMVELLP